MTIFPRLFPVLNKAIKPFLPRKPIADMACAVEEIWPAETSILPPVVMLDDDWDRITAVQEETSWEAERLRTMGGTHIHQATRRYTFENVLATPWGCYMLGRSFHQAGKIDLAQILRAPIIRRAAGYFGQPVIGMNYFGHWLRDGMPASLLKQPHEDLYFPVNPAWQHAQAYCRLLDIDRLQDPLVFFDRLSVCADIGQNQHLHKRMRIIQDTLHSKLQTRSARGVFIKRGKSGAARILLNEDDVADTLAKRGFNICAATDDLDIILAATAHVDTVVTVEGSHWAHAFFAANHGAQHVTLNPSDRFNNLYVAYMPATDSTLATLVMERHGTGYMVDLGRLNTLLDMVQR
jgi:hypothetical protein